MKTLLFFILFFFVSCSCDDKQEQDYFIEGRGNYHDAETVASSLPEQESSSSVFINQSIAPLPCDRIEVDTTISQVEWFKNCLLFAVLENDNIEYFVNQSVERGFLVSNQNFSIGINEFNFVTNKYINFYIGGNVKSAFLSRPHQVIIQNNSYIIHNNVSFYENGNIENFELNGSQSIIIKKNVIDFAGDISFYKNGNVRRARLDGIQTLTVGENTFNLFSVIFFYENGNVWKSRLSENHYITIGINDLVVTNGIDFYSNGNILKTRLAGDQSIYDAFGNSIYLDNFTYLFFSNNGSLASNSTSP